MTRAQTDIDAEMAEAVDWLVRLQGEAVTERDWLNFDAWLTASPAHAQAYDAVLTFDDRLTLDSRLAQAELAAEPLTASLGKVVPLRPARRVWIWSAGAAIAAAFVAGAILLPGSGLLGAHETTYVTGVGERRTVALEDGSRIEMNAASRMTVRFERRARRVHLDDAQAFFDVAKDASRPFLVSAGDTQVRVVGTQFDVRQRDGQVAVNVQRGLVEVRPNLPRDAAPFRLRPGQGLSHRKGQRADARVQAVAVEEIAGWRKGRLIYRDQPLSQIAGDMNRLFPRPVKLADAEAANLRLSGVLIVDDQDAMVDRLSHLLPVRTTTTDDAIVIRAR
ncbi:transmembrane sensor [Caulobacter rhizosphaerae]|jgi:transmembrane sensor|uniref:Transmembrane sensor n=1 Tax=Caulobacter rhizosphaerae TaxID=2010972 RepID=A0ABU1N354_9CAUL|nr:FecR domain-containing protein [Caulobacter rhizosphaerae]MDR6532881.1 transmembrane sensor [Caulobacter rhizosphaerae]